MKYRIITNGERFRAQRKTWLFWDDLFVDGYTKKNVTYDSAEEAESAINRHRHHVAHKKWKVV